MRKIYKWAIHLSGTVRANDEDEAKSKVESRVRRNEDSILRLIGMIADPDIYTAPDGSGAEMITHGTLEIGGVERQKRANVYYFAMDGESLAGFYEVDPDTGKPADPEDSEANDAA